MMFFPVISTVIARRVANDADRIVTGSSTACATRSAISAEREIASSSSRDVETVLRLCLPDSVQQALLHALEVTVSPPQMFACLRGDRVLNVHVLAAAALEKQADLDLRLLPLLEVDHGSAAAGCCHCCR